VMCRFKQKIAVNISKER